MRISWSRRRKLVSMAAACALSVGGFSLAHGAQADSPSDNATLQSDLDSILANSHESGAEVTLTVRNADTGATLYDANGSERLIPASNAKLYTSTAALDILGPDYTFRTQVLTSGTVHGHVLDGNVYLKGFGDPMETAADYQALAKQLAEAGIKTVHGSLVADDTFFDSVRLAPFWSWDDEPYYYSAQTSALNVSPDDIGDTGTVLIDVSPAAKAGGKPTVTMIPANNYLTIKNTATTGAAGSSETVDAEREYGKNVIDVTGSIPAGGSTFASQPTVNDPTGLAANIFGTALAKDGVHILGKTSRAATPASAKLVAEHDSEPLSQILTPYLKLSNNMISEVLSKSIGEKVSGEGTWAAGSAAVLAAAKANGVDTSTVQLFDGSGLGRADYTTSEQTTKLLEDVRNKPWFNTWYNALPIAGESGDLVGGTLEDRMAGTAAAGNLHGKTGSMTGVSALSGYITDAAGDHLVFSMMSNNFVNGGITTLEDDVAVTLANYAG